jgi:cation diffusion facilitator family transporter
MALIAILGVGVLWSLGLVVAGERLPQIALAPAFLAAAACAVWVALLTVRGTPLGLTMLLVLVAFGLGISFIAALINLGAALVLIRAGRRHRSITLEADGQHLMSDVWTSAAVIAGVALVYLTGWLRLDPLVALAVAAYVVWVGIGLVRRSVAGLMDAAIGGEEQGDRAEPELQQRPAGQVGDGRVPCARNHLSIVLRTMA